MPLLGQFVRAALMCATYISVLLLPILLLMLLLLMLLRRSLYNVHVCMYVCTSTSWSRASNLRHSQDPVINTNLYYL